jgi:hypothetical protein
MPRYVDIDPHGRVRVFHSFATEICHRDLEESGQLLGVAGQATDPAVRVVQDRQVSPAGRLASARPLACASPAERAFAGPEPSWRRRRFDRAIATGPSE